jgi:outer membrane protein TolC
MINDFKTNRTAKLYCDFRKRIINNQSNKSGKIFVISNIAKAFRAVLPANNKFKIRPVHSLPHALPFLIIFSLIFTLQTGLYSQQNRLKLTLEDAIELARKQSPDALMAKHKFRASYWQYRSYQAKYLPSLSLNGNLPYFNKSISKTSTGEGSFFSKYNENSLSAGLSLTQQIGLTGGNISVNTGFERLDNFIQNSTSYNATLLNIAFRQPLIKYNSFRWERMLEPMLYEEARRGYIEDMEQVSVNATNLFFNLLSAQIQNNIAGINEANYDTIYKIAQGRFNLGKIAENDLLQLELQYLRASSSVKEAALDLENQQFRFRSYLRLKEDTEIELVIPVVQNYFTVDASRAVTEARTNSSTALAFTRRLTEAASQVAQAKYQGRFDAELFALYGLSNDAQYIEYLNDNPSDQQHFELGISLPILDWGVAKGKIKMAQSNQEIVKTTVEQEQIDFNQEVFLKVSRFNMQYEQVLISAKADTVAQKGYDITKARYLIGRITITDLNIAQAESDNSKSNFISALGTYWRNYYDLRRMTLFDWEKNVPLIVDYKELL